MPTYIDVTPSWGQWGNTFYNLAATGERKPVRILRRDFARAMSMAEALNALMESLSGEQHETVVSVMQSEMKKQGF